MTRNCKRCGYKWKSLKEFPKTCPRCKSHVWMEPREA